MSEPLILVDLDESNFDRLPCCGVKNAAHPGRREKICWLRGQCSLGARAKVLLGPGDRQCGYVEYIPGEYAWRGVDAKGWMFIHCVWTLCRQYQRQGFGARMIEAAVADARREKMAGVAVLARESPWLAGVSLFLANGFEAVASAPPDYQLLVKRLKKSAPAPAFSSPAKPLARYGRGLTIVRSAQCPHIAKFAGEIAEAARNDYGMESRIVEIDSHRDAQHAPTPYAVFAVILNGQVISDHQISRTRFHNIMRKRAAPGRKKTSEREP